MKWEIKKFKQLLDAPAPSPGKFLRWKADNSGLENTDEVILPCDNGKKYRVSLVIDPESGAPTLVYTEL